MRRVSPKMAKLLREYSQLRAVFILAHPRCEAKVACTNGWTDEVHHKAGRGANLLRTETWLPCCRACHQWCHNHPKEARQLGFTVTLGRANKEAT